MIRKTALLTGIAGLMLAAPAFAQEATPPSNENPYAPASAQEATPPAPAQTPPAAAAPAQPGTLTIQPGSDVKGSDGSVLGKLEGVRNTPEGKQELTVRGSDGKLRGVPLLGVKPEGTGVAVAWTLTEYEAAPAIAGAPPAPAASAEPAPASETESQTPPTSDTAAPVPAEPQ